MANESSANESFSIGVDIGGTKIAIASVDSQGKMHSHKIYPTQVERGSEAIIKSLAENIREICNEMKVAPEAVGVGLAGQISEKSGIVHFAPNLNWTQVHFGELLQNELQLPVKLINDVRAATWAEWKYGAGMGQNDLVCLFIGTGIGGGIVSDGRLLTGSSNCAGELGHMTIALNGLRCTCGNLGCLEAFAGGWAVARQAQESTKDNQFLLRLSEGQKINARHIVEAALQGDPLSNQILNLATDALIAGCTTIVNGLNPSRLIIGGGFGHAIPGLLPRLQEGVRLSALIAAQTALEIIPAQLKNDAGVIGAANYARS